MISITLSGADEVRARLRQIGGPILARAVDATAEDAAAYIRQEAGKHSKSGALVRSVGMWRVPGGWDVGHDAASAPQALWVHWGTKPHDIRPKSDGGKKALRWASGGAFHFAKLVHHPGYGGDPWLVRAAARAPADFQLHITEQLAKDA